MARHLRVTGPSLGLAALIAGALAIALAPIFVKSSKLGVVGQFEVLFL